MLWECHNGHQWLAQYDSIRQGSWCHECRKNTIQDAQKLAESKGGKCLSTGYKNCKAKMLWRCGDCDWVWLTSYSNIRSGKWRRQCAGNIKNTIQDAQELAEKRNGKCLSKEYKNNETKMLWQCEAGHQWKAMYRGVQQGQWCPSCPGSKTQRKLNRIVKLLFPKSKVYNNYRGFEWLYNKKTKKKQEIDIWVPEIKLAIEYDGEQHFEPRCFGGMSKEVAEEEFKITKRNDRRKNRIIKNHPEDVEYFIRFNYKEPITKEYIIEKLKKNGVV